VVLDVAVHLAVKLPVIEIVLAGVADSKPVSEVYVPVRLDADDAVMLIVPEVRVNCRSPVLASKVKLPTS